MSLTPTPRWLAYGSVLLCTLTTWAQTPPPAKPVLPPEPTQEVVTKVINLLDHVRDGKMDYHINPKADIHGDPKEVYKLQPDGALRVSGEGYGSMVTKGAYKDYHLVCEFKWGEKTWGNRTKRSRDNGILVHCFGPIGAQGGAWMASIEAQIIEGGVGDILVLSAKTPDGIPLPVSISAELGRSAQLAAPRRRLEGQFRLSRTQGCRIALWRVDALRGHREGRYLGVFHQRCPREPRLRVQAQRGPRPAADRSRRNVRASLRAASPWCFHRKVDPAAGPSAEDHRDPRR